MEIKVLGIGCPKCRELEKTVINCLAELDIAADLTKVEDINEMMEYGILRTPALVINGTVAVSGRVPSGNEIKELLTNSTLRL